jgi:hypothetical protein
VFFFPIRHHSPGCAMALQLALDEIRPAQVLVEGPIDFESLLPLLTDPRARPPIAIVSLPSGAAGDDGGVASYPFCVHSPEYVALCWAKGAGATSALIDLPARHPEMQKRLGDDTGPTPLIEDWRLDHNAYVAELCARRGVSGGGALWDALFEAQGAGTDWRGFFEAVGVYCGHIRAVTPLEEMENDGTLARETQMAACLRKALEGPGPIAVVTGGFHTSALRTALATEGKPGAPAKALAQRAYLVRYGFRQLDRAGGYGAGLPHPAWYDRLWRGLRTGDKIDGLAAELLTDFADHLRKTTPQLGLATPTLAAAIVTAERLAALRDLPWPGRAEVIDAVRSTGVKDAIEAGQTPLLAALDAFLTGDEIGDLPPGAAQPPIVESVRARARTLGFNIDTGQTRTRDLDLLRRPRHAQASEFLFALDLIGAQFAKRIGGPDPLTGWRGEALFEIWSYAWSPMVESRLIGSAVDGDDLEDLCRAELARRRTALADQGLSRSVAAVAELLIAAARTGYASLAETVLGWCAEAMAVDPEAQSVIRALSLTASLAANSATDRAVSYLALRQRGFDRLLLLFPRLADTPADRLNELIRSLADLAALVGEDDIAIDRTALAEVISAALESSLPAALNGALIAFAGLIGALDLGQVADRIAAALEGTYVEPGERAAALTGCLTVAPKLLLHSSALMGAIDRFLAGIDTDAFLAVLPELRLALGQLTPSDIDRAADWVATRYGLDAREITQSEATDAESAENLALSDALEAIWRADGLGHWFEARP